MDRKPETASNPDISVVIPTLNAGKTLRRCLESIRSQDYSGGIEIVIADGGSADNTLETAADFKCRVVDNPGKTGEAGKARGLKASTGDIVALIDSDNILPGPDWMSLMAAPFRDRAIAGSEPLRFEYRKGDPILTRYCALLGMNDPVCYFIGNYDRESVLSGTWTGMELETVDKGDYLEVILTPTEIPTIGANGFMVRRELLDSLGIGEYLFDIDVVHQLVEKGHIRFAKVKTGIVHLYGRGLGDFSRKQLRRVRDFSYFQDKGMRTYPWSRQKKTGLLKFIVYTMLVFPLACQAIKGCLHERDSAWLLHIPACVITLVVYAFGVIEGRVRPRQHTRNKWHQ
ncbi:MAG: glycosyltransferase family 2 protein [Actinobacteria bacterium]|nr:glycosyltransferase family 2 protein [Actinomycetota bacterium]